MPPRAPPSLRPARSRHAHPRPSAPTQIPAAADCARRPSTGRRREAAPPPCPRNRPAARIAPDRPRAPPGSAEEGIACDLRVPTLPYKRLTKLRNPALTLKLNMTDAALLDHISHLPHARGNFKQLVRELGARGGARPDLEAA